MSEQQAWTVETLKIYFEKILEEKDRALQAALTAAKEAVSAALNSSEKAVNKAEENATRWRENANEWRGAMMDREGKFVSRFEYDEWKRGIEASLASAAINAGIVEANRERLNGLEQRLEMLEKLVQENRSKIDHVVTVKQAMAWAPLAGASIITAVVVAVVSAIIQWLARR